MGAITGTGESRTQNFQISEDVLFYKITAALPMIGLIPFLICDQGLAAQVPDLANFENSEKFIRVLEVKNDFRFSLLINSILSTALLVILVFANSIHLGLSIASTAMIAAIALTLELNISLQILEGTKQNNRLIALTQSTGKIPDNETSR